MVKTYTRFVWFGKNFLWMLVAGMIALVVWIGSGNSGDGTARLVFTNIPKSESLQNVMMKPHYQGVDAHNKPFTVTAEHGVQQDKDTMLLDTLRADMIGANGEWMAMNAGAGELNNTAKTLKLTKSVELFYEGGYQFRTDHADVDIGKGTASGDSPVQGQGPAGTLEAKNFSIVDRGDVIHFNGAVKVILYQ